MTAFELSVVVPSVNGWSDLRGCLRALRGDDAGPEVEILVVDRVGEAVRRPLREEYPEARLIAVDRETSIPEMRAVAIRHATAPHVAIIEDHVLVPVGWARSLIDAQRRHGGVVGGSVSNVANDRLVDRAAFLCEYSHLLPQLAPRRADWLTGNNTIYPRALLEANRHLVEAGRWEDYLHRELRRTGVALTHCPEVVVDHRRHYTVGEYLAQRYWYGRSFAGTRLSGRSLLARLGFGCGAITLLPPLLLGRIVGRIWKRPAQRSEAVLALPLIGLFVAAWGAGEAVGYWFGEGEATRRVC